LAFALRNSSRFAFGAMAIEPGSPIRTAD
jgi:hypothetical protein